MANITINEISVDPFAESSDSSNQEKSNYILIQTRFSLTKARRAKLANLGVRILEYVPRYSYVCFYPEANLEPIRALPFISWVNVYPQGFKLKFAKIGPALPMDADSGGVVEAPPRAGVPAGSVEVDIVFHENVDPKGIVQKIGEIARLDSNALTVCQNKIRAAVKQQFIADLTALDEVRHLEETGHPELLNTVARRILRLPMGNGDGHGEFEGEGQIVVVADSGFDSGLTDVVHPAFRDAGNQSRVIKLYPLGRPDNADDPTGHGTHVAGSVLGDGNSQEFGPVRGTAPKARLIVQALFGDRGIKSGLPADLHDLFVKPYQEFGARIHSNSWGNRPGKSAYDRNSFEVDKFVWNHRDCVICFAAGNEGSDHQATGQVDLRSITAPGTAKNCITVGASESDRPEKHLTWGTRFSADFPAEPIASDRMADDIESVAATSSRGPTFDERWKPDVVAPGTFILSAKSVAIQNGLHGLEEGDANYYFDGGTSMATPLVAGCVALVREYLAEVHQLQTPSAALVKALLINGAKPLALETTHPNSSSGFGRVDMAATIGPFAEPESVTFIDEKTLLTLSQEEVRTISIAPPVSRLKVTLVWIDPPGEHLQNDLDLIVKAGTSERHGNMEPTSTDFDRANNVEQVNWEDIPAGEVEIIVRAARIATLALTQPYALVIRTS